MFRSASDRLTDIDQPASSEVLKCHYDQILDTHVLTFSYTIVLSLISRQISTDLLRTLELTFSGPLFPRIYGRHYFSLFQLLVENWRKWRHIPKNITRVEIIITITTAVCMKNNIHFGSYIGAVFYIVIVISTRAVFLRI